MMNKKLIRSKGLLLFFLLALVTVVESRAQSIEPATINAAGNAFSNSDMIFEWSVGEMALVETMISAPGSITITNGLLQPILPAQFKTDGFLVYPSNIITPNGDGKNDTWVIKELDRYPDNEVTVFDRGGRIVFTTKNYQNDWTGKLSGKTLSEDTYYYIIKLKKDGKDGLIKGFITIIHD